MTDTPDDDPVFDGLAPELANGAQVFIQGIKVMSLNKDDSVTHIFTIYAAMPMRMDMSELKTDKLEADGKAVLAQNLGDGCLLFGQYPEDGTDSAAFWAEEQSPKSLLLPGVTMQQLTDARGSQLYYDSTATASMTPRPRVQ